MALLDVLRRIFGAPTDSKNRRDTIDALLPLLREMRPPPETGPNAGFGATWGDSRLTARPGLTFEGNIHDPADDKARFMAQCCIQLVREHPEYALLGFSTNYMIVRREDLDKYASKEVKETAMRDGVLSIRDNLVLP